MPAILTATDFSEAGNAATHYACQLASTLRCSLTVLHTYMLPIATADQPYPLVSVKDIESIANDRMELLINDLKSGCPGVQITGNIVYGDWRDNTEENITDCLLIVVGNDGSSDSWLGSNTLDAARNLKKPLLAVPTSNSYKSINAICLACDAVSMQDLNPLRSIIPILDITGAEVHLVHVRQSKGDPSVWDEASICEVFGGHSSKCYNIDAGDGSIDEAIHQFAIDHEVEWLAFIPHHHSFFHNLFGKSHTRAALKMADLPVLTIH